MCLPVIHIPNSAKIYSKAATIGLTAQTHGEQGLRRLVQPLGQGGVRYGFLSHVEAFLKPGVKSRS